MEKRTYKKVMDVPTEMLVTEPVLVDQIKDKVTSDVINGLVGLLSTGSEYIVSLSEIVEMPTYTADFMSRFEQKINLVPLVRCKDCKYFEQYTDDGTFESVLEMHQWDGECSEWVGHTYMGWFCSRAERRTYEND